jgi:ribosomal protein S27AE
MHDSDDEIEETLAECPKCGASVYDDIEQCPRCGEWITGTEYSGSRGKRTFVVVVALVLLSLILFTWILR